MAFTFYGYQPERPMEQPLNNVIKNILGGYTEASKARYLQPTLEEELQKAKLFNKWYEPNIKSEIGLRGAHAGLLGEQKRGAQIENQFLPEFKKAQIEQLKATADKARLLQMIREQLLGGGTGSIPNIPSQPMQMYQGQGMPALSESSESNEIRQPAVNTNAPGYAQAAIAQQSLGLGMPKIVDVNGKQMAISPFGIFDTGVHGLTEQQKSLAKEDAKKISKLEDIVLSGTQKSDTFNELNSILGSEEFEALRQHPILGRHELGWYQKYGTPEQQDVIGKIKTYMGNIIKDSARDFAGQFRIGEQALLNDMKPNVGDSLDVMKGKAEALTYLNTMMTKRAEMEADLMRNYNMSALQAKIATDKAINPSEIKKDIKTILHPASSKKTKYNQADLEYTARKHNMSVAEVLRKLGSQ